MTQRSEEENKLIELIKEFSLTEEAVKAIVIEIVSGLSFDTDSRYNGYDGYETYVNVRLNNEYITSFSTR